MHKKIDRINQTVFAAVLVLYGGFYDWNVSIAGVFILTAILVHYLQRRQVYKEKMGIFTAIPILFFGFQLAVSFWAVDWACNISGILRGSVILLWLYLCIQMREEERDRILRFLPIIGVAITAAGIISLPFAGTRSLFWMAERFGGVFQYANTCALFLFCCIVIQIGEMENREKKNFKEKALLAGLLFGMLLTGSRSILLLFFFWGVYKCFKNRHFRIPFLAASTAALSLGYLYILISGSYQNVGRIFTLFTANSTMYGRLLYLADAAKMLVRHPFGMGYLGYYYIQGAEQTGVYHVRFVHNDFVQAGLDYGIPALLLLIIYLGWHILKGKQNRMKKELLALLCAASLTDFHLQYLSILMVGVLCLDLESNLERKKRSELRENYFFLAVGMAALAYVTVPFAAVRFGDYETALSFFPDCTEAQLGQMAKAETAGEATALADGILEHNSYLAEAYDYKAYAAAMEGDYTAACEYKDRVIGLKRYDVTAYQSYDALLEDMLKQCAGDAEAEAYLAAKKEELPGRLGALKEVTSPLAFKIRDVPEFQWEDD